MRKVLLVFSAILLSFIVIGCSDDSDSTADEVSNEAGDKPKLTFGLTPWTSTVPPTKIAQILLEDMGYEVEEREVNLGVAFAGLSNGDVNVFMDYWSPNHDQYMDEYSDTVEILATSYEGAEWGVVAPEYMEDINDIGDIEGKEDLVNNEVLAIEESDPAVEDVSAAIDGYGLDLEVVHSSEAPMLAEAEEKMKNKEPVLFFGWRPHSMFNKFDIKILEHKETPDLFQSSTIYVVAHEGLKDEAPDAYELLKNWSISIDELEEMISKIDDGEDPRDVAQEWIDNNEEKVEEMLN